MYALTGGSNTLLFESDTAYLQAAQRDLQKSGLAWAEYIIHSEKTEPFGTPVQLDTTRLGIRGASLTVTIPAPKDARAKVYITSSISRARRTLNHTGQYHINARSEKPGL